MSAARRPVILDVDTGIDDACALLLAGLHDALDLRAVTCVGGNAPLPQVVSNTLAVLHTAGRDGVPVAAGADRPLLAEPHDARHVHGADGMGDLGWPRAAREADARHAVELIRDVLRAAAVAGERVTLVPLAPLTNIALLLRTYPDVAAGIEEICFMGGAATPRRRRSSTSSTTPRPRPSSSTPAPTSASRCGCTGSTSSTSRS